MRFLGQIARKSILSGNDGIWREPTNPIATTLCDMQRWSRARTCHGGQPGWDLSSSVDSHVLNPLLHRLT
jgi:hypothetical protein